MTIHIPRSGKQPLTPYVLLTLASLFWGGNAVAGQLAIGEISPMALTCLRWLVVAVGLLTFYSREVIEALPTIRQHKWGLLLTGSLGFTVFNFLFYYSAYYTEAMNILIIQGALPLPVLIASAIMYRQAITINQMIGMALVIFGVIYLATRGQPALMLDMGINKGDLLIMLACLIQAAYTISIARKPPLSNEVLFCGLAISAFVTSVPMLVAEIIAGKTQIPTLEGLGILAYVAVFPSTLAQIFFIRAIACIGPGRTGFFVNLTPVFGSGLAILLLGEVPHAYHAISLACVVLGIVAVEIRKRR
ncbi:drug/metabolite transporter (DMT)-like permease [Rhodoligotrophos appendicifer]|uniref:DMT family transporter n=1 Tax=Rhodoligotrophos appendicifer TaxID=987056 RepID=UPI00117E3C51|nr:DMT family transporter [Rhodoligotrophos appendicifer]